MHCRMLLASSALVLTAMGQPTFKLMGNLDKIQFSKVDAVCTAELNSGKQQAKDSRKSLNRRIDALRERGKGLHERLK